MTPDGFVAIRFPVINRMSWVSPSPHHTNIPTPSIRTAPAVPGPNASQETRCDGHPSSHRVRPLSFQDLCEI